MLTKIKTKVDNDLAIIYSMLRSHNDSESKYHEIISFITKTYPDQEDISEFMIYPVAYNKIQGIFGKQMPEELLDAISDLNEWLIGTNFGYDGVKAELDGDTTPQKEIYDYLVSLAGLAE